MLDVEHASDDAGPEAARRVQRAAGVVDADKFGDEECEADADGGYERRCLGERRLVCMICRESENRKE